ncbi:hypothetical protein phiV208_51 [Vibrio phage phiV208]|nr:hypothetical protein phiV208_51 [Vibrio phage phiV208]
MNLLATSSQPLTMSSREIAEYTGKQHQHVKRDIEKMLNELELDVSEFGRIYKDTMNRNQTEYLLDRDQTDCLLTGYSAKARMKVIKRWKELEKQSDPQIPQTYAEALQLAADQAKQLELAAPKVAFVDNLVERTNLLTATQVAQKHGKSAIWLNKILSEMKVYNRAVKRGKVFQQWFVDKGYGEMKKNEIGYDQPLFTNAGEVWINEKLFGEGLI